MFKAVVLLEAKKLVTGRNRIFFVMLFCLLSFFCWDAIYRYKGILSTIRAFPKLENEYGTHGFELMFIPAPLSLVFDDLTLYDKMVVDIGAARVKSYNAFNGAVFLGEHKEYMNVAGIMLLLGGGLALIYGYGAAGNHEYLSISSAFARCNHAVFIFILVRVVLLNSVFWVLSAMTLLWPIIAGIEIGNLQFLYFMLGLSLVITCLIFSGALIGSLKNKMTHGFALLMVYLLLLVFIPGVFQKMVNIELQKDFKSFQELDSKRIKTSIAENRAETKKVLIRVGAYQTLAAFFPTTFYFALNKELSSQGFLNLIDFYCQVSDKKAAFIEYEKNGELVLPHPNGNTELFYAPSRLPGNFVLGILVSLVWLGVLAALAWIVFKPVPLGKRNQKMGDAGQDVALFLKESRTTVILTADPVRIAGLKAGLRLQHKRVVFVPAWSSLPGEIKVKWLFSFCQSTIPEKLRPLANRYCRTLPHDDKAKIIYALIGTVQADVFVFTEFLSGLSDEFGKQFALTLNSLKKGRRIVFFSHSLAVSAKIADDVIRFTADTPL